MRSVEISVEMGFRDQKRSRLRGGRAVALAALLAWTAPAGGAEPPASWGDLVPGPHAVGFRVFQTVDRTRGYWPLRDYRGEPNPQPTHRPVQVAVWYPARPGAEAEVVRLREYVALQETALGASRREARRGEVERELRDEIFRRYFPPDGPSDAELEAILDQTTAASKDAPYAPGEFPLVIHSGFGPFAQSVLLEYLASHGYVVVTTHMLGSSPAWFHRGSGTLEWWQQTARDVGYLRAFAESIPPADVRRTAVLGMTAAAGLLDQMSSMHLSALIGIEAGYPDVLLEAAEFEPARFRIPMLDVVSRDNRRTEEMLPRLVFADRWQVRLDEVEHVDLYGFKRLVDAAHAREQRGYAAAARLTRRFLDAHLRGDGRDAHDRDGDDRPGTGRGEDGRDDPSSWLRSALEEANAGEVTTRVLVADPAIPSEQELLLLVREGRHAEATEAYRAAAGAGHGRFFAPEPLRTMALFRLYDDGDPEGAAAALRILLDAYPQDVEGWRFLARALEALGDRPGARQALEKAAAAAAELPAEEERARLLERIERDLSQLGGER